MKSLLKRLKTHWVCIIVGFLVLFRLLLNAIIPLMDKTEARYAEIARIMSETKDYVVLQIDYGVPFWAKPPLSTWLSALSFNWFGVNEFAARLPSFLLSILMAMLLVKYAKRQRLNAYLPVLVLFTLPEFFLHAGVVSTDTALAFCVCLVMLSFWEVITGNKNWYWKYLFFVGIGLGLLAKGPIIGILTVPPLLLWTWCQGYFKRVLVLFPWFFGIVLIALIATPWYYFAEQQSPGFFDYFVVKEHFKRFFDSSWTHDKYGFPKKQPYGMIWVFLFIFALPWIQVVIYKLSKKFTQFFKNRWLSFLLFWLLWTPLFFTTSTSLIHPYILPITVPLTLLVLFWWKEIKYKKVAVYLAMSVVGIAFCFSIYMHLTDNVKYYIKTDKYFVEKLENQKLPFYQLITDSYSGNFYTQGKLETIQLEALINKTHNESSFILFVKNRDIKKIPEDVMKNLKFIMKNKHKEVYISLM